MITNNQIKFVKSLHKSKFRQKYNNFIAEGDKIAQEILQNSIYNIVNIFATQNWTTENEAIIEPNKHLLVETPDLEMAKISHFKTSSPVLIVLEKRSQKVNYQKINEGHAIYLDDVQDPGNLGTIIRIADWFGIPSIIRSNGCADFYNPKVIQSTMGSFMNVDLYTEEFDLMTDTIHKTVGAVMHGDLLNDFDWPEKTMLIMGNEGKGISSNVYQKIDFHVTIPGDPGRLADSLNVGMATGILCSNMLMN